MSEEPAQSQPDEISRADVLAQVAKSRRLLNAVIQRPCPVHDVGAGVGCWTVPAGDLLSQPYVAVCDERIDVWKQRQRDLNRAVASGVTQRPERVPRGFLDPERVVLDPLSQHTRPSRASNAQHNRRARR